MVLNISLFVTLLIIKIVDVSDADVVADDADIDVNIGKERVGFGGVRGYADVCVELHYGRGQHH